MNRLPPELILHVFGFVSAQTWWANTLFCVCRQWQQLAVEIRKQRHGRWLLYTPRPYTKISPIGFASFVHGISFSSKNNPIVLQGDDIRGGRSKIEYVCTSRSIQRYGIEMHDRSPLVLASQRHFWIKDTVTLCCNNHASGIMTRWTFPVCITSIATNVAGDTVVVAAEEALYQIENKPRLLFKCRVYIDKTAVSPLGTVYAYCGCRSIMMKPKNGSLVCLWRSLWGPIKALCVAPDETLFCLLLKNRNHERPERMYVYAWFQRQLIRRISVNTMNGELYTSYFDRFDAGTLVVSVDGTLVVCLEQRKSREQVLYIISDAATTKHRKLVMSDTKFIKFDPHGNLFIGANQLYY